jgi:hypothetical protein
LGVTIGLGGFGKSVVFWKMMDFARWEVPGKLLRKNDFEFILAFDICGVLFFGILLLLVS